MWWETLIVALAVGGSLLWLGRTLFRSGHGSGGSACDGCGPKRPPARLQAEIPVLDLDR